MTRVNSNDEQRASSIMGYNCFVIYEQCWFLVHTLAAFSCPLLREVSDPSLYDCRGSCGRTPSQVPTVRALLPRYLAMKGGPRHLVDGHRHPNGPKPPPVASENPNRDPRCGPGGQGWERRHALQSIATHVLGSCPDKEQVTQHPSLLSVSTPRGWMPAAARAPGRDAVGHVAHHPAEALLGAL